MSPTQIANVAIEISTTLWWVRMEEIVAFFEAMKKQTYGKIYERLDPAIIWEHWEKYDNERNEYCEQKNTQFRQSDPRPEGGGGAALDGIAGVIGDIKQKAERLRKIKPKK